MTNFNNLTGTSYAIVIVNLLFGILFKFKSIPTDVSSFVIILIIYLIDLRNLSKGDNSNVKYKKLIPAVLFLLVVVFKVVFIPFPYV